MQLQGSCFTVTPKGQNMTNFSRLSVVLEGGFTELTFLDDYLSHEVAKDLASEFRLLVEKDCLTKVVINFRGVRFLSSMVLNELVLLLRAIENKDGALVFCGLIRELEEVMVISRLNRVFKIAKGQSEARKMIEQS